MCSYLYLFLRLSLKLWFLKEKKSVYLIANSYIRIPALSHLLFRASHIFCRMGTRLGSMFLYLYNATGDKRASNFGDVRVKFWVAVASVGSVHAPRAQRDNWIVLDNNFYSAEVIIRRLIIKRLPNGRNNGTINANYWPNNETLTLQLRK